MGAKNVSACFALWSHLDHAPFRLLVGMALVALDEESDKGRPGRLFFGGEAAMVELLGRSRRQTFKALAVLRDKGAVKVEEVGRNGHRAVYRLELDPTARVHLSDTLQERTKGAPERHPSRSGKQSSVHLSDTLKGAPERHPQGAPERHPEGCTSGAPLGTTTGTTEESRGGEHHRPAPQDRAREDVAANPDSSPEPTSTTPAVPLSPSEMTEYETCSASLRARLGDIAATEAAMKFADEHDCSIPEAVIALAKVPA